MKKYYLLLLPLLFSLSACQTKRPAESNEPELTKLTFVLDWAPNTNHTGIYVAQEQGYFEAAGLDVVIIQPPEDSAELLVGSGKAHFGVSFQDSMMSVLTKAEALPIQAVAAILQHNTSGILSRAGEGLDRPKGLAGKNYATWDLDLEKAMLRSVVEADGGDYDQIKMLPSTVTDEVAALDSQSVDAVWVYYGWGGIAAETAGLETDYFAFAKINPVLDYYTPVIIGNTSWMEEHPEQTRAFLAAARKGYEFAIANPEQAAALLCQAVPELDSQLVSASQQYMKDQYQAEASQWGMIDPQRWNAFYQWAYEQGLTEQSLMENQGFTNDYLFSAEVK